MSISNSYPTQRPSLNLVFNGGSDQIDSRLSYSRSSSGTAFSSERHESSQNLAKQSQSYDTTWTNYQLATSGGLTGSQSAPDGTSTAWLITSDTQTPGAPFLNQVLSGISSSTEYTVSAYLKAGTASHGYISLRGQYGHIGWAEIDFSNPLSPASGGANFTNISTTSTAVGSTGWYRLTLTCTTSTVTAPSTYVGPSDGTDPSAYGYASWNCSGETIYVWGHQVEKQGSATVYNATTTQISRSFAPTLKSHSSDQPRFEYSATDGQSVGLLIESQATSLITYSEDFSHAFWDKTRLSIDSNVSVAPDGALTASSLRVDGTAASTHRMRFSYATGGATPQTFSIFAKAGSKSHVALKFDSSGGAFDASIAYFNLASGTTGTVDSGVTAKISACGNGWYRCSVTRTALASATGQIELYVGEADNDVTIDGNSYDHILCWGAMVEANTSAPSSYIKSNSGSSTSRAADSCSVTVSDVAGFADTEGAVVVEATVNSLDSGNAAAVSFSNAAGTEYIKTGYEVGGVTDQSVRAYVRGSSLDQAYIDAGSVSATGSYKVGVRYEKNNVGVSLNGASAVTDTVATMPIGMTTLYIGSSSTGTNPLNANLKRIAYYSEPLSDTNLTALTS